MSELSRTIKTFLESEEEILRLDKMYPISEIEEVLDKLNYERGELDGEETNGWQVDFRYSFISKESKNKLCLGGSLWYGEFKITKE